MWHKAKSIITLLGSGVFATIGLVLIASNRWSILSAEDVVFILLFFQWQVWGLTICKMGTDQTVFALVTSKPGCTLGLGRFMALRSIPLVLGFTLLMAVVFNGLVAAIAGLSILLDVAASIMSSELNAHQKFRITATANLLNYPLFFLLLLVFSFWMSLDRNLTLLLFLSSSIIRFVWLAGFHRKTRGNEVIVSQIVLEMGLQQAMNYLLFRFDLIIISVSLKLGEMGMSDHIANQYLYLAKYPELISKAVMYAGFVLFPVLFIQKPIRRKIQKVRINRQLLVLAGYCLAVLAGSMLYIFLWNQPEELNRSWIIPFAVHGLFVMPVNLLTYSMLRQGHIRRINRNLVISLTLAALLTVGMFFTRSTTLLLWLVPVQLGIFTLQGLFCSWGSPKSIYRNVN